MWPNVRENLEICKVSSASVEGRENKERSHGVNVGILCWKLPGQRQPGAGQGQAVVDGGVVGMFSAAGLLCLAGDGEPTGYAMRAGVLGAIKTKPIKPSEFE